MNCFFFLSLLFCFAAVAISLFLFNGMRKQTTFQVMDLLPSSTMCMPWLHYGTSTTIQCYLILQREGEEIKENEGREIPPPINRD